MGHNSQRHVYTPREIEAVQLEALFAFQRDTLDSEESRALVLNLYAIVRQLSGIPDTPSFATDQKDAA